MSLTVVAEILSGETMVSPSGPVDTVTTTCEMDEELWESSELVGRVPAHQSEPALRRPVEATVSF